MSDIDPKIEAKARKARRAAYRKGKLIQGMWDSFKLGPVLENIFPGYDAEDLDHFRDVFVIGALDMYIVYRWCWEQKIIPNKSDKPGKEMRMRWGSHAAANLDYMTAEMKEKLHKIWVAGAFNMNEVISEWYTLDKPERRMVIKLIEKEMQEIVKDQRFAGSPIRIAGGALN